MEAQLKRSSAGHDWVLPGSRVAGRVDCHMAWDQVSRTRITGTCLDEWLSLERNCRLRLGNRMAGVLHSTLARKSPCTLFRGQSREPSGRFHKTRWGGMVGPVSSQAPVRILAPLCASGAAVLPIGSQRRFAANEKLVPMRANVQCIVRTQR